MVHTRSSTKNTKGGSASRVSISAMIADAVKVKANCEQAIPETTYHSVQECEPEPTGQHHNFCILCQDGGDLWPCSNCERVVCSLCMTVPVEVQEKVCASDIVFECVCCHWLKSRRSSTVTPYWATGGPVEMATQVLVPYFPNGGFRFIDLPFDIGTKTLTDHSDNSRSDLFFGATPGAKNKASLPSECLDALLSPFNNILHGGLFVLLACGSVVRNEECFVSLQDAVVRHRFSSTIAFDAERLQTVLTSNLIMGVVECMFIEGYPVQMAMPEALGESSRLRYHLNVNLLTLAYTDTTSQLTITKFMWSHRDIWPWGAPLPTQCPQCGCIQVQWFKCANNECGKVNGSGPQKFRFTKALDITLLKPGKRSNSAWLEMPMGVREFPLHVS
ncbi:hypothetical protein BKA82DRAFT_1005365 [Pisolithus tinctorius]|uniref:Uncharacterized protein n=1 Tax=Pisolithus tinctorius Marx 270 TaxID=870435 RepID=A0A0C3NSB6_PISTI|nr:hypothetical protein BKA82DRAFT_1005365 [Pisolithus tinctorius]KIN98385.1 hypothetical protein M404DRAFT_1005365 [Pisolithus tinctorius Marx 270]